MSRPLLETAPDDRLLILGASGWFGQTFRTLLSPDVSTLLIASSRRGSIFDWDWSRIQQFQPTVVVNFAFLTKRKAAEMPVSEYWERNRVLTERFLQASRLASTQKVITVSSGAAVQDPESAYGASKVREETAAAALRDLGKQVGILRAYSVSGDLIRHPSAYAFSDFVNQALNGRIVVEASRPTFRRYVGVADALKVLWANLLAGETEILETGGELVEMRELATAVAECVNPAVEVCWTPWISDQRDNYYSNNASWTRGVARSGINPLSLTAQIEKVAQYLRQSQFTRGTP